MCVLEDVVVVVRRHRTYKWAVPATYVVPQHVSLESPHVLTTCLRPGNLILVSIVQIRHTTDVQQVSANLANFTVPRFCASVIASFL